MLEEHINNIGQHKNPGAFHDKMSFVLFSRNGRGAFLDKWGRPGGGGKVGETQNNPNIQMNRNILLLNSFFWMSNGKPISYENWNSGEPNNFR